MKTYNREHIIQALENIIKSIPADTLTEIEELIPKWDNCDELFAKDPRRVKKEEVENSICCKDFSRLESHLFPTAMETLFYGGCSLLFASVFEFQLLAREVAYNEFCDEISDVKKTLPIGILVEINNHRIRWDRRERIMMKKKQIEYESEEYWNDPVVKDRKQSIEDAMKYIGDKYPKCREKPLFIPVIKSLFVVPHDVNGDLVDQVQCEMMEEESQ